MDFLVNKKNNKRIIIKNPDYLTMGDQSALNLPAKETNKFEYEGTILSELVNFASSVPDFRRSNKGNIRHRLRYMLILIIFARASEATLCRVENISNNVGIDIC